MDMSTHAEHLGEADAIGRIMLEGEHAPVYYHLIATQDGAGRFGVRIELSAPRDWLIDRGFDREALLVRENGARVRVRFENKLSLEENVSVNLEARDSLRGSLADLAKKYPELEAITEPAH